MNGKIKELIHHINAGECITVSYKHCLFQHHNQYYFENCIDQVKKIDLRMVIRILQVYVESEELKASARGER